MGGDRLMAMDALPVVELRRRLRLLRSLHAELEEVVLAALERGGVTGLPAVETSFEVVRGLEEQLTLALLERAGGLGRPSLEDETQPEELAQQRALVMQAVLGRLEGGLREYHLFA